MNNTKKTSFPFIWWSALVGVFCWLCACSPTPSTKPADSPQVVQPADSVKTTVPAADLAKPSNTPTNPPANLDTSPSGGQVIPVLTYKVIAVYPHDRNAFTQGLIYEDGLLYEGTGIYGRSTVRRVALFTGQVLASRDLPAQFFGEGITIFKHRIIQLTWQSGVGFVYDQESLELIRQFSYPTEGWGITHDGQRLIMSDGSSILYFLDPESFKEIGRIEVHDEHGPVWQLNELEYIQGEIYANIWRTDRLAKINPTNGQITAWINLEGLLSPQDRFIPVDVLNGIAFDQQSQHLLVTGKLWPKLFEIELIDKQSSL